MTTRTGPKRALIDLSSVIWTCLLAGKDSEFGKEHPSADGSKMVWVNSAGFGLENAIQHLTTAMADINVVPRDMIFVVEGKNSKADRQALHPAYKAGRDKVPEQYAAFNVVKEELLRAFLDLGAQSVTQDGGVESDDVIGYLSAHLAGETWIVSADKDLAQCVGGDVHHYRMGKIDANPFGEFSHDLIPVYIALVGDPSDKIKGCPGFGDIAFQSLQGVFGEGGLRAMLTLIKERQLEKLEEDVPELKSLQKIIDHRESVYLSYELGRLRTERVNTLRRPLQWTAGVVKPAGQIEDERLRKYGGKVWLVSRENFEQALAQLKKYAAASPEFALDIETSTPPESDDWLLRLNKDESSLPVDVLGSELTGMGLTFGRNMHLTYYMTVDHVPEPGVSNLTVDQVVQMLEQIPRLKHIVVHNAQFELPVCFMSFGKYWQHDELYRGFLPNVIDTRIMSSYVNENRSAGLKYLSKQVLGYEQESYDQVTTMTVPASDVKPGIGRVLETIERDDGSPNMARVSFKMNQLTARHVLSYGSDDTICTAALSNHFRTVMEIEGSWSVFMEIEQFPAYLTAKGFVDGADFSLQEMSEMEKLDDVAYDKAWGTLRAYLISIGFDGVHPPVFEQIDRSAVIQSVQIVAGEVLTTAVRTPSKLAKLIVQEWPDNQDIQLLAHLISENDVLALNALVAERFKGEPKLDLSSPRQMCSLLYDRMGLPVNLVNDITPKEREGSPDLVEAIKHFKRLRMGLTTQPLSPEELGLVRKKASSNDSAVDFALAFDSEHLTPESREALKAIQTVKTVITRRNLFYRNYWPILHWKTGKIHASANQCAAVTRRYSYSDPNLQQLPKKGSGARFRRGFIPHKKNAVIASIDWKAQELRLAAERSQDANMLACYIGDKLKDVHNITAAGAMQTKWGPDVVKEYAITYGAGIEKGSDFTYDLFTRIYSMGDDDPVGKKADDLRKEAKNVNFAAQFGGQALKLSETIIMPVADAQLFLDARSAMFPDVDKAAKRAENFCIKSGYALTMMGVRRHLRAGITSEDSRESSRAARQAWNMEIQGSAAEMAKLAMTRFWKSGALFKYDARFIAIVHDELVTSVAREHAVDFIKLKHECMTGPYCTMGLPNNPKSIPILGSISIGPNFGQQIEVGDDLFPDRIEAALNDIFKQKDAS